MNSRLRVALLVSLFFGVPALLTLALITSDYAQEAKRGLQPGGTIRGLLVGPERQPAAGVDVELFLDPTHGSPGPSQPRVHTTSDEHGVFELHAPPLDGRYTIVAGGGTWQHAARSFSFVGVEKPGECRIELVPGCALEIRFAHADGSLPGEGSFDLDGSPRGFALGFGRPAVREQGHISGGVLRVDALPPMKAHVLVRFDSGESLELELELEAGKKELGWKL